MRTESIEFSSEDFKLHGVLTHREDSKQVGVVILHPHPLFGGDMNNHVVHTLERVFVEEEYSTLRFDFRGAAKSPHGYSGVRGAVIDTMNAIKYLQASTGVNEVGIVGYSFGASTAIRTALLKSPRFLVTLSASVDLILEGGFDTGRLSGIQCPVLMFHGDSDRMISPNDLSILRELLKLEEEDTVLLEREGHFYQWSLPSVSKTLRIFLENLSS
ncbi:MAG: dienelactone hydrolase family protein [Candidatus Thorarchaeota archaeon]